MNIFVFFVCTEFIIALFVGLITCGIHVFLSPGVLPVGITLYILIILSTGLNIIWMTFFTTHWRVFFGHIFQTGAYIWSYLRIFFSWFVPGITISQTELDEANNLKIKKK